MDDAHVVELQPWRRILLSALKLQEMISVRGTVANHVGRTPTRAEIAAAERAAHQLEASRQATIVQVAPSGPDTGRGSARLLLTRPGVVVRSDVFDELGGVAALAEHAAEDLAGSVDSLRAAVRVIPVGDLDHASTDRLVAWIDASLGDLRRIRQYLDRAAGPP